MEKPTVAGNPFSARCHVISVMLSDAQGFTTYNLAHPSTPNPVAAARGKDRVIATVKCATNENTTVTEVMGCLCGMIGADTLKRSALILLFETHEINWVEV